MKKPQIGPFTVIGAVLGADTLLLALRFAGVITKPWLLVTAPLWLVFAVLGVAGFLLMIWTLAVGHVDGKAPRR
jgi:hypothetical protein